MPSTPPTSESSTEPIPARRQRRLENPLGRALLPVWDAATGARVAARIWRLQRSAYGRASAAILDRLYNSQTEQTGVVLSNGPSINQTNLAAIGDHPYILMNRGYLLKDRLPSKPVALCVTAGLVVSQYATELAAQDTTLLVAFEYRRSLGRTENTALVVQDYRHWHFAKRISSVLHPGYTVTFLALQLAYHLGWTKVLIVGLDHRYDVQGDSSSVTSTVGHDSNHFDRDYFAAGTKWLLPDLRLNEHSYLLAREANEESGRRIVDCTVNGACPVFERGDLATELGSS